MTKRQGLFRGTKTKVPSQKPRPTRETETFWKPPHIQLMTDRLDPHDDWSVGDHLLKAALEDYAKRFSNDPRQPTGKRERLGSQTPGTLHVYLEDAETKKSETWRVGLARYEPRSTGGNDGKVYLYLIDSYHDPVEPRDLDSPVPT